jgi:hypothetical protein
VSATEGATFVPQFLDGSRHVPQRNDAYVQVRLTEPARPGQSVTVSLPNGTALIVSGCDLLRLAPADDPRS